MWDIVRNEMYLACGSGCVETNSEDAGTTEAGRLFNEFTTPKLENAVTRYCVAKSLIEFERMVYSTRFCVTEEQITLSSFDIHPFSMIS